MCRHFSKVTYCLMQYVPKHTWKLLVRIRQVIMAVNIKLTLLRSAFNKYLNLCLQIFKHDFTLWTNIQCSDAYYKSAVWHGTKAIIQMQTFYSSISSQCKPHQKMIVTVLDIAVLWQSLMFLQRTSISALIFQAGKAFNRDNESSLGMVAMRKNNNLTNEVPKF